MAGSLCLLCGPAAVGQTLYGGLVFGGSNYQGELKDDLVTFRGTRPAFGAGITGDVTDRFSLSVEYMQGMLGGNDRYNTNYLARRRNLSFDTRFHEFSLQGRVDLMKNDNTAIVPYLFTGFAVFRVDPFAYDTTGVRHYLYPLTTEGQGLDAYPDKLRHTYLHVSIPMGGGLELRLTRKLKADLELSFRKTFTDHIDDVSGYYPDEFLLLQSRGPLAVQMSYRADELPGGEPFYPRSGTPRGNSRTLDWYYSFNIRIRYALFTAETMQVRGRQLIHGRNWPYRW
jgi:hypothetical protein